MPGKKKILYKSISLFLKALIAVASLWYIYSKIFQQNEFKTLFIFDNSKIYLLLLALVLMFLNWSLETLKWKLLISRLEEHTFFGALTGVLCGLTVSIFTPNRIGEFSGRIFLLQKANRIDATLLTFAGNAAQLFITLFTPVISFLLLHFSKNDICIIAVDESDYYAHEGILNAASLTAVLSFILVLSVLVLIFLFGRKIKNKYLLIIKGINTSEWLRLLTFSLLRYAVFFFQFYLLLLLFDVNIPLKESVIMIPLIFYLITILPTLSFTEIGVRSSTSLLLLSMISENSAGILSASLMLWVINLALPAIAGLFFVFRLKFFRKE